LYATCLRADKIRISQNIVDIIRTQNPAGRFLVRDSITGTWSDIGDKRAIEKTRQALREGQPLLRRQIPSLSSFQLASTRRNSMNMTVSGYKISFLDMPTPLLPMHSKGNANKSEKSLSSIDTGDIFAGMINNKHKTMEVTFKKTVPSQGDSKERGDISIKDSVYQTCNQKHDITDKEIDDLIIQTFLQPIPTNIEIDMNVNKKPSNDCLINKKKPSFIYQDIDREWPMETIPSIKGATNSPQDCFIHPKHRATHQAISQKESDSAKLAETKTNMVIEGTNLYPPDFISKHHYGLGTEKVHPLMHIKNEGKTQYETSSTNINLLFKNPAA